jgi:fructose/tagatose bisphosphate aldolase
MMIPMGELLAKAKKEGYGVAAPNVFNRETIEACFLAAKKLRAPIILDVAAVHGIYECADIARYYEKQYPEVPFALNLDHGGAYEDIVKAIHAGFSSVMIDRSTCAYEKNVEEVKEIVKIAHAVGTSVEAELGHVGQGAEYEETKQKSAVLYRQNPKFDLISTGRIHRGKLLFLKEHLNRLQESSRYFSYPFNKEEVQNQVEDLCQSLDFDRLSFKNVPCQKR